MSTRRDFIKAGLVGSSVLGLVGLYTTCGQDVNTWAQTVVTALEQALPIFEQYLPQYTDVISKSLDVAKALEKALKDPNSKDVVSLLEQLVASDGLFNQLLDAVPLIQDEQTRNLVSGILVLAGVALRLIADHIHTSSQVVAMAQASHTVSTFEQLRAVVRF